MLTCHRHFRCDLTKGWSHAIVEDKGLLEHGQRRIWSRFLTLREAPTATDVPCCPSRHRQGMLTLQRHYIADFRLWWPFTSLFMCGQRQIRLVWAYLGSFFEPEGGPYGHKCVVRYTWTPSRQADMNRHSLGDFRQGWPLNIKRKRFSQEIPKFRKQKNNGK